MTGLVTAVVVDTLLGLGVHDPHRLAPEERVALLRDAAADGRVDESLVAFLREHGIQGL